MKHWNLILLASLGAALLAETVVQTSTTDSNGSFTAELEFPGSARWNA